MNNEKDLLTIAEFAAAADVSKQAIYSQLETRLKQFVQVVDGVKMLKYEALEKFYLNQVDTTNKSSFNQVEQVKNDNSISEKLIDLLSQQLEIKDKQIEELNKRLAEMSGTIQQQQQLLDQQQKLTMIEKKVAAAAEPDEAEQEEPQQQNRRTIFNLFKRERK
jgi:hypothetical protein